MIDVYKMIYINIFISLLLGFSLLYFKFVKKKNISFLTVLILVSILPVLSIFRYGTYQSGDLTNHAVVLHDFYQNLTQGNFIPLWAQNLCGGYGCPVFITIYTLPYYISSVFHFLGFSLLDSTKLVLAAGYIFSGVTMYFSVKDLAGKRAGFIAGIVYLFAPIRFIQMHFLVSVGSNLAYVFIPLAFLLAKKSLNGNFKYIFLYSLNFLFLIMSHPNAAIIIIPLSIIYVLFFTKKLRSILYPILGVVLGTAFSAFYTVPILYELKYTWMNPQFFDVYGFKQIWEYLYSPARLGLLFQTQTGNSVYFLGYAQLLVVVYSLYLILKSKIENKYKKLIYFLLAISFLLFILLQSFTEPFWQNFYTLKSFQFVGRLFVELTFLIAIVGGLVFKNINKMAFVLFCAFVIFSTILNWQNRNVEPYKEANLKINQLGLNIYTEYFEPTSLFIESYKKRRPITEKLLLDNPEENLEVISGNAVVKENKRLVKEHGYTVDAQSEATLVENTQFFPGWKLFIDGRESVFSYKDKRKLGLFVFNINKGKHSVVLRLDDTKPRKAGKSITFLSLIGVGVYLLNKRKSSMQNGR